MIDFAYPASTWLPYLLIFSQTLTGIAWPVAAFIALRLFKGPITQAIGQLKEVALPGGARAQFQSAKTATEGAQPNEVLLGDVGGKRDEDIAGTNLPNYLLHNEDLLLRELAKYPEVEHKAILVRALVFERLHKHFAVVYSNIFGSQIRALEILNQRGGQVSTSEAASMFESLKQEVPDLARWSLDQYLNYLVVNLLVARSSNEIALTDAGKDFLVWITELGLPKDRLL